MQTIIATFFYQGNVYLIDEMGQVWTQDENDVFAKIDNIDLFAEITEENTRA